MDGIHDLVDGGCIQQTHQVEPEAVDVVLLMPVQHGFDDVLADHLTLRSGIIAAARAVGVRAIGIEAREVTGNDLVEAECAGVINMVVDHVHHNADVCLVQGLDHLLELIDTDSAIVGIGGVRAFGRIVVDGIIAPVEVFTLGLIHGTVVIHGQQVQVGNAQCIQIVNAGDSAVGGSGSMLGEGQILASVGFGNTGGIIDGEVTHVQLVDDGIGVGGAGIGVGVLVPTGGVGGCQVKDHTALAVDAGGAGIGVNRLGGLTANGNFIGVIDILEVTPHHHGPSAICTLFHDICAQCGGAFLVIAAGGIQFQVDGRSSRCPNNKIGACIGIAATQIGAGVGKFFSELIGSVGRIETDVVVVISKLDLLGETDSVLVQGHQIQRLGQRQGVGAAAGGNGVDDIGNDAILIDGESGLGIVHNLIGDDGNGVFIVIQLHVGDLVGIDHIVIQVLADGEVAAHIYINGTGNDIAQTHADLATLLCPGVALDALAHLECHVLGCTAIQGDGGDTVFKVILGSQSVSTPSTDVPFSRGSVEMDIDLDDVAVPLGITDEEGGILITALLGDDKAIYGVQNPVAVDHKLVLVDAVAHILQRNAEDTVVVAGHGVAGYPVIEGAIDLNGVGGFALILESYGGATNHGADGDRIGGSHNIGVELALRIGGGRHDPLLTLVIHKVGSSQCQVNRLTVATKNKVQTLALGGFISKAQGVEAVGVQTGCGAGPGAGGIAGCAPGVQIHTAPAQGVGKVQGDLIFHHGHGAVSPGIGCDRQQLAVVPVFAGRLDHDVAGLAGTVVEDDAHAGVLRQIGQLHGVPVGVLSVLLNGSAGPAAQQGGFGAGIPAVNGDSAPQAGVAIVDGHPFHRLCHFTGGFAGDLDFFGVCIESDGHIADGIEGELIVAVSAGTAPGIGPGAIGDLEGMGTCRNAGVCLFIQTGLGVESHGVVGVGDIPCGAAQVCSTGNDVGSGGDLRAAFIAATSRGSGIAQSQGVVSIHHQGKGYFHITGNKQLIYALGKLGGIRSVVQRCRARRSIAIAHVPSNVVAGLYEDIAISAKGRGQGSIYKLVATQVASVFLAAIVGAVDVADQVIVDNGGLTATFILTAGGGVCKLANLITIVPMDVIGSSVLELGNIRRLLAVIFTSFSIFDTAKQEPCYIGRDLNCIDIPIFRISRNCVHLFHIYAGPDCTCSATAPVVDLYTGPQPVVAEINRNGLRLGGSFYFTHFATVVAVSV